PSIHTMPGLASNSSAIQSLNITCVINTIQDMHVPVSDDPESRLCDYFDPVADQIQHVRGGVKTFLHWMCWFGPHCWLQSCPHLMYKTPLIHKYLLRNSHSHKMVRPNSGFWKQLIEYKHKLHGKNTVHLINSPIGLIPDLYERETRVLIPL
uniref:Uncharacterized protein n=1 Tax=Sinocyclocheilus anshuiensis TaxID=1608454 RepID=A0A671KX99_9TELE